MRKIEVQMIEAVEAGVTKTLGNTSVLHHSDGNITVSLHGNVIARRHEFRWQFTLAGWNTPTTRSRINALAAEFGRAGVTVKGGIPYSGGVAVGEDDWF